MKTGSGWTNDAAVYALRGYVRATELVHSESNGWHVHYHVAFLLDDPLSEDAVARFRLSTAKRFIRGVESAGGYAHLNRQELAPAREGPQGLSDYLLKGTRISTSHPGLSRYPMAILRDLKTRTEDFNLDPHEAGRDFDLWQEFDKAVRSKKRIRLVRSDGLKEMLV